MDTIRMIQYDGDDCNNGTSKIYTKRKDSVLNMTSDDNYVCEETIPQFTGFCSCLRPVGVITIVILINFVFIYLNFDMMFKNAYRPKHEQGGNLTLPAPLNFINPLKLTYNHLRIGFAFINSFLITLSLVLTWRGYYTLSASCFKFQRVYILFECSFYIAVAVYILISIAFGSTTFTTVLASLIQFIGAYFLITLGPRIIISLWIFYMLGMVGDWIDRHHILFVSGFEQSTNTVYQRRVTQNDLEPDCSTLSSYKFCKTNLN
uniref:Uncharacterized protein n=1 Tax=Rhabditophanes sp. KR3021 TaxID=114890 RepID=A0AC35UET4_9BILA